MQWLFAHLPPQAKQTQQQLHQHWRKVGGVPRLVLRGDLDAAIHSAIRNTMLDEVFPLIMQVFFLPYLLKLFFPQFQRMVSSGGADMSYPPHCHPLINITVDDKFDKKLNRLSSPYIARLIALAVVKQNRQKLCDLIRSANASEGMSAMAGNLYEGVAAAILRAGGSWEIRELHRARSTNRGKKGKLFITPDADNKRFEVKIVWDAAASSSKRSEPPVKQSKIHAPSSNYAQSASPVSMAVDKSGSAPSLGLVLRDERLLRVTGKRAQGSVEHIDSETKEKKEEQEEADEIVFDKISKLPDLPEKAFGLPEFRNLVGADVIIRPHHAFQMTVSDRHRISINTFRKQVMPAMRTPVSFMFVVPSPEQFDEYTLQTFTLARGVQCKHKKEKGGDCIHCAEEAVDLVQYVICVPVPEFDWADSSQAAPAWASK